MSAISGFSKLVMALGTGIGVTLIAWFGASVALGMLAGAGVISVGWGLGSEIGFALVVGALAAGKVVQ
ncbi:hypothetical protein [Halopiger thermotolerans]